MGRKNIVQDADGRTFMEIDPGEPNKDFSVPQPDDDGVIPEFVNISNKRQNLTVPNNPSQTISVPPMGILRGAQWRDPYTQNSDAWGRHPYFVERVREVTKPTKDNPAGYDRKYVLTEEQMVAEINFLGIREENKKRIRFIVDNAILNYDEESGRELMKGERKNPERFVPSRSRDDRIAVVALAEDKVRAIEKMIEDRENNLL